MRHFFKFWHLECVVYFILLASIFSACAKARDETVAGVVVPVPSAMQRVSGQGIELAIPGFGGGKADFHGDMAPEKIIEFYQKEMPARGWQPGASLLGQGGMLTYTVQGKSVLLAVGKQDGKSTLSVTVTHSGK
jgi:hypothetical protein